MATWSSLNFQDSSSPLMEQLNFFHDHSIMILLIVTVMISYLMISMFMNKIINRFLLENQMVEMIWTILPSIILIFLALPSLRILYLMDELISPSLSLKTIGHQWYWSYEYSDFSDLDFDSYMIPQSQNSISDFRLLEVDNRMVIPTNTNIRLLVSSTDVIHSWAMPSLGLKMDANPGRINQLNFMTNYSGLFFGQCSEICGSLHSFMPIVIESTNKNNFITWLLKNSK